MASVGGFTCWSVSGGVGEPAQSSVSWVRPGIAGIGAMVLGLNDSGFAFSLIQYDSRANILIWCAAIRALKGQVVTIVTDRAVTYTLNMFIESVTWPPMITPALASGGVEERAEIRIAGRMTG